MTASFRHHEEARASVPAPAADVFAFADDHRNLAGHMSKKSGMMMGSRLATRIDAQHGRALGSRIRMDGRVMGLRVALDEAVTERDVPRHKAWQTVGEPRLLVIGSYRMGFDVTPEATGSRLRVYIDYDRPSSHAWMGWLLGRTYARWCVRRMARDVQRHFAA